MKTTKKILTVFISCVLLLVHSFGVLFAYGGSDIQLSEEERTYVEFIVKNESIDLNSSTLEFLRNEKMN